MVMIYFKGSLSYLTGKHNKENIKTDTKLQKVEKTCKYLKLSLAQMSESCYDKDVLNGREV